MEDICIFTALLIKNADHADLNKIFAVQTQTCGNLI
jgi:hypothetical protein